MTNSLGNIPRTFRGDPRPKNSIRDGKRENQDWLSEHARVLSPKEGAQRTGMTPKAFENLRTGHNKISFDNLIEWCRADPDFRAQFFAHCGGHLENDPEFVAGLSRAMNVFMRGKE